MLTYVKVYVTHIHSVYLCRIDIQFIHEEYVTHIHSVMSHVRMRVAMSTYHIERCHVCEGVCHAYLFSHVTHIRDMTHSNVRHRRLICVTNSNVGHHRLPIRMWDIMWAHIYSITHVNIWCRTFGMVMSRMCVSHTTRTNETCQTRKRDMTHI